MHAGVNACFLQATRDHLGYQIGLEIVAVRFCEDQTVILVVLAELALVFSLLVMLELKRNHCALPKGEVSRLFALGAFDSQTGSSLLQRLGDEKGSCHP